MIDKALLSAIMMLLTLSLVMSYSLSTYAVLHFEYVDYHFFIRQCVGVLGGFSIIILLSKLDPDRWFIPLGFTLFILFALLIILMQFFSTSWVSDVGGAKRWIDLGVVRLSPVEFFKVGFVFFLAWSLSRKFIERTSMGFFEEVRAFSPYLFLFFISVIFIAILQKDLGQVIVLGGTLLILFLFVGSSLKFFFSLIIIAFSGFAGLILYAPHRLIRIKEWWAMVQDSVLAFLPFESVENLRVAIEKEPYQISNALNAIHNGGMFGTGLGNGQFKLGYLSDVHTDFILAGITEELGFFGLGVVSLILLFVVYRIFQIAAKVKNPLYYLFSIGVGLLIAFSFLLNAYGIAGITPIKGIAVPFLSYGGSHILASSIAIGMVLMVSKKVSRDCYGCMV